MWKFVTYTSAALASEIRTSEQAVDDSTHCKEPITARKVLVEASSQDEIYIIEQEPCHGYGKYAGAAIPI
jgi:hypothetical protein